MEKASTEPTDRSMPPMTMTRVMPMARMPSTVTWSRMLRALRTEKKYSEAKENTAISNARPISGPPTLRGRRRARRARGLAGGEAVGALASTHFS